MCLTWVWHEHLVNKVDDTVGGDNVLLANHLYTVDCQAFAITADLNVVALKGLIRGASHDGLRALDWVQEVETNKSWKRGTNINSGWNASVDLNQLWLSTSQHVLRCYERLNYKVHSSIKVENMNIVNFPSWFECRLGQLALWAVLCSFSCYTAADAIKTWEPEDPLDPLGPWARRLVISSQFRLTLCETVWSHITGWAVG